MIQDNLRRVQDRLAEAVHKSGRQLDEVRLIAVSKKKPISAIQQAHHAGQIDFGENYLQDAVPKIIELEPLNLRWHAIGHVQSNKLKLVLEHFKVWHSLSSEKLLRKVAVWQKDNSVKKLPQIFLQVNVAGEASKDGANPEDVMRILQSAEELKILISGLMTIPPIADHPADSTVYFKKLRQLSEQINAMHLEHARIEHLSMGMSGDMESAIAEGATMVRVGQAIFGPR